MPQNTEELYNEDYQRDHIDDLIGNPPSWLLKSGIGMIAIVFLCLMFLLSFIKYPDKISCGGYFTSDNPPLAIVSKTSGVVREIFVNEGDSVEKGDPIIFIENTADKNDINKLEEFLDRYERVNSLNALVALKVPKNLNVGGLQNDFAQMILKLSEVKDYVTGNLVDKQIETIETEIEQIGELNTSLSKEQEIFQQEEELIAKDYERSKELEKEGVISQVQKEGSESKLLSYKQQAEAKSSSQIQNKIRIEQLKQRQLELKNEQKQRIKSYKFSIAESIQRIRSGIKMWSEQYYIEAPESGTINLGLELTRGATITTGNPLAHILQNESNANKKIIASVPVQGMAKIELGHKAILKVVAYPYKEYGVVETKVVSILPVDRLNGETFMRDLVIALPDSIITSHNKEIKYEPLLKTQVDIITEDKSILARIFDQFLTLVKQQGF